MTNFSVLYEDDDLVVINKPAGLMVHKADPDDPRTSLADMAVLRWPQMKEVGDPSTQSGQTINLRPGIVHRLDRDTSGLMLLAKNQKSFEYLKSLFQKHEIQKTYLALVYGTPREASGTIDLPVARIGAKTTTRTKGTRTLVERTAQTDYRTIKTYNGFSLLAVQPKTGRTHQIRAHLKALGVPTVGDRLYSSKLQVASCKLGIDRLFLHAWKLTFIAPSGARLAFEADLPDSLQKVLDALE